jgi:phosphatidate cytidylyltransferase
MKVRVITALVLVAILVPIFYYGGLVLDFTLVLFSMGATFELYRLFNKENPNKVVLVIEMLFSGGIFYLVTLYYQEFVVLEWLFFALIFLVVVGALLLVFYEKFATKEYGNMFISVLYPAIGFSAFSGLGQMEDSLYIIGFLFLTVIMTDTFAYIFGVRFGKHRLAVKISPKKSVEGSVFGTLFAIAITLGYVLITGLEFIDNIEMTILSSIVLIFVISVFGQIGDLVASKMKRDYGVKDYSKLFPGHGGLMDRFDSAIFAAMVLMLLNEVVGML